jgi:hypothetical protein
MFRIGFTFEATDGTERSSIDDTVLTDAAEDGPVLESAS